MCVCACAGVCVCVRVCACVYVSACARTYLTGRSAPAVVTRVSVHTSSAVETVAGGCVAAFGTSAGEDARALTGRRTGESTSGTCRTRNETIALQHMLIYVGLYYVRVRVSGCMCTIYIKGS